MVLSAFMLRRSLPWGIAGAFSFSALHLGALRHGVLILSSTWTEWPPNYGRQLGSALVSSLEVYPVPKAHVVSLLAINSFLKLVNDRAFQGLCEPSLVSRRSCLQQVGSHRQERFLE